LTGCHECDGSGEKGIKKGYGGIDMEEIQEGTWQLIEAYQCNESPMEVGTMLLSVYA
jgi:hypothetical protein